ncbi:hypothetical protein P8452_09360 [Trifolium repens]|nr:hypothetical protein P8452_09360 [Trifolium repens]
MANNDETVMSKEEEELQEEASTEKGFEGVSVPTWQKQITTCVVAASGIAFSGGFGSYLFAMSPTVAQQSSAASGMMDVKIPGLGWMISFLFVVSFLATYIGVGMICPYIINISLLIGGILSWGVMWPLIEDKKGDWYPSDLKQSSLHGLQGYKVFIAISMILGDGLYSFVKVLGRTLYGATNGGVIAGLAACGVMMNIVSTASDLMQDFKTGYMTLASPKSMFVSQVIGTAMGCIISLCVFWLFYHAFGTLGQPGSAYPAPFALVYRNIAILGEDGVSALPKNCLVLCCVFFAGAIVINLVRDLAGEKYGKFIPVPMAIPFYIGSYFAIDMCVGSLILFVWKKVDKVKADAFGSAVASGLICGDGVWSLPSSFLALAGVQPPICMKFLSRAANAKVDAFLGS